MPVHQVWQRLLTQQVEGGNPVGAVLVGVRAGEDVALDAFEFFREFQQFFELLVVAAIGDGSRLALPDA